MIISRKLRASQRSDQGYILVTLMLFVALMAMALAAVLPELTFQMKRDREEEMVHRGAQYARAVRAYYRKFGSYPPSIDLLVTSNNFHFLRKRYKDPVTGEDFKLLHVTDVKLSFGGAMGGGTIPGAQTLGNPIGGNSNLNSNSNSNLNSNSNSNSTSSNTTDPNAASGSTNSSNNSTDASQQSSQQSGNGDSSSSNSPFTSISGNSAGQTFGGGPIVGVASTSTKESIRIYNKKDHYNDWQFIYDPTSDRGGLITGPYQPTLQAILPGQNGMPNGFPGAGGFGGMGTPSTPGVGAPGAPTNPNMMQH